MRFPITLTLLLFSATLFAQYENTQMKPDAQANRMPDTLVVTERYAQYQLRWHKHPEHMELFDSLHQRVYELPRDEGNTHDYPYKFHFDHGFLRIKYGDMKSLYDLNGKAVLSHAHCYYFNDSLIVGFICSTGWFVLNRDGDTLAFRQSREENETPGREWATADTFWAPVFNHKHPYDPSTKWICLTNKGKQIGKERSSPPANAIKGGRAMLVSDKSWFDFLRSRQNAAKSGFN